MTHITAEQKEIMLDFIKSRPRLYAGKFSPEFTRQQSQSLWQELATILNSHSNGAKKEWSAWRKTWIDIKKNCKAKAARQKKYQMGTGGGPSQSDGNNMDVFESNVIGLMSPVCIAGNVEVPEPSISLDESFSTIISEDIENIEHDQNPSTATQGEGATVEPEVEKEPSTSAKSKRKTKTQRLKESIQNHAKLVQIARTGVMDTKTYREKKLQKMSEHTDAIKELTSVLATVAKGLTNIEGLLNELI
ncbi:uncharacterized protein LOC126888276 [Diabrotica virgifera virgifera]|nr:uncharacterized protein LOC114336362 [Diabrotica virgifera virgifera]XP_050512342.1 uncharacterized protein LOC126888276 [Diabrotica virgifera virgifera]